MFVPRVLVRRRSRCQRSVRSRIIAAGSMVMKITTAVPLPRHTITRRDPRSLRVRPGIAKSGE